MPERTRWIRSRLARAAYLAGTGRTESQIADDVLVSSRREAVRSHLATVGISARREDDREVLVAVPAELLPIFRIMAKARGRGETGEELVGSVLAVLAEEPTLVGNILDDDDANSFNLSVGLALARRAVDAEREAAKVARSAANRRERDAASASAP